MTWQFEQMITCIKCKCIIKRGFFAVGSDKHKENYFEKPLLIPTIFWGIKTYLWSFKNCDLFVNRGKALQQIRSTDKLQVLKELPTDGRYIKVVGTIRGFLCPKHISNKKSYRNLSQLLLVMNRLKGSLFKLRLVWRWLYAAVYMYS